MLVRIAAPVASDRVDIPALGSWNSDDIGDIGAGNRPSGVRPDAE